MDEEQLVEFIKNNLRIEVDFEAAGKAYWTGDHQLHVKLVLREEVISEHTTYLPNP